MKENRNRKTGQKTKHKKKTDFDMGLVQKEVRGAGCRPGRHIGITPKYVQRIKSLQAVRAFFHAVEGPSYYSSIFKEGTLTSMHIYSPSSYIFSLRMNMPEHADFILYKTTTINVMQKSGGSVNDTCQS
jgi:hypothetical protein